MVPRQLRASECQALICSLNSVTPFLCLMVPLLNLGLLLRLDGFFPVPYNASLELELHETIYELLS